MSRYLHVYIGTNTGTITVIPKEENKLLKIIQRLNSASSTKTGIYIIWANKRDCVQFFNNYFLYFQHGLVMLTELN